MDLIFLDTETTGFGECRLVELAWKYESDPAIGVLRCKPPIPIEAGATGVHGIRDVDLEGLPAFAEHPLYPDLAASIAGGVVVAHNAPFDIGVLAREGIEVPLAIDTQRVAKHVYPHAPNHKLQGLRSYLQLDAEGDAHSAAGDVAVLIALFDNMRATMEMKGTAPEDVLGEMMRVCLH